MESRLSPLRSRPASVASSPLSSLSTSPSPPASPDCPPAVQPAVQPAVSPASPVEPQTQPDAEPDTSCRYPSPMSSSTLSGTQSPIKLGDPVADDSPRPTKKPRLTPSRTRSTAYLDLIKPDEQQTNEEGFHLKRLVSALHKKKKVVVVAGAGISVSAGVPDFRSSTGLFATAHSQHKLKASGKHLFDASVYKHDSSTQSFHTMVREMAQLTKDASPTIFHQMLASLASEGRLLRLYSQNIDCIDTSIKPLHTQVPLGPKGPWPPTIQLHGGLEKMVCTKCNDLQPFDGQLFDGPEPPLCATCKAQDDVRTNFAGKRSHGIGRLRPRFVLYNEFNPDDEAIGNVIRADLKARPDAVIVVGTTLKVPGTRRLVKEMCQVARGRRDGLTAWINIDSEPKGAEFKDCWDLVVRSTCDNVAQLVGLPPHDCDIGDDYLVSQEQYAEKVDAARKSSIQITFPSSPSPQKSGTATEMHEVPDAKPRQVEAVQRMPTPRSSPPVASTKMFKPGLKQGKISFAANADVQASLKPAQAAKTKAKTKPKPRPRKVTQPVKAKMPPAKPNALQAFKASKKIAVSDTGRKKLPGAAPTKKLVEEPCSLPSLRPEVVAPPPEQSAINCASSHAQAAKGAKRVTPEKRPLVHVA